jgi:hypothetical protein
MYRGRVAHHYGRSMMTTAARSTFSAAGRTYGGQRNRFMIGTTPEGTSEVVLGDGEVATVTVDAEGNTVISIENKPIENGNGEPVPMESEPVTTSFVGRLAGSIRQKMSWQREGDGTITFTPDENETLDVDGDSVLAVITAVPTTSPAG